MQKRSQFLVIYTSESLLRHPLLLFKQMWRDLLASRGLAWRLLVRDISAQYRKSFLGILWAFLPPVATAVGLTLANNAKVINISATDLPYPAYVMLSMTLWQTFVEALNGPMEAITKAKVMLAKINFPREALILAQLGQVFFNFGIKLILIAGLFIAFRMPLHWTIILAPVALIHLIALGTFFGMMLAPLGVLYNDVSKGMTFIVGIWLLLTPVIYPIPSEGIFGAIVRLNPVTPLIATTRDLATKGVVSEPVGFWIASGIALGGLLVSWVVYRLAMPFIIERTSA
ncbi:MAG: ABC transporter permease [Hormoscilla sp. GM7CHS1pb]|nr:ABC transporter permease [Hormoscilla sp. GM7CHS1pb]